MSNLERSLRIIIALLIFAAGIYYSSFFALAGYPIAYGDI